MSDYIQEHFVTSNNHSKSNNACLSPLVIILASTLLIIAEPMAADDIYCCEDVLSRHPDLLYVKHGYAV
jgi:hypothetical protein